MAYQSSASGDGRETTQRTRFVAFTDAYHGDTVGSVSLGGIDLFHGIYKPLLFDALRAPYPYCYRCPRGRAGPENCGRACVEKLEELLAVHGGEVCAVVIEPLVQGAAGIITAPEGYLREAAAICRRHGALLVCDEVATGFGRTGTMFACEQEGVEPDFLCVAKGITAGTCRWPRRSPPRRSTTPSGAPTTSAPHLLPRPHLHGEPAGLRGGAREPRRLRARKRARKAAQQDQSGWTERLRGKNRAPSPCGRRAAGAASWSGSNWWRTGRRRKALPGGAAHGPPGHPGGAPHGLASGPLGDVVVLLPPLSIRRKKSTSSSDVTARPFTRDGA